MAESDPIKAALDELIAGFDGAPLITAHDMVSVRLPEGEDQPKKRVFIAHRWMGRPNELWYPYVQEQLAPEYETTIVELPNPEHPRLNAWADTLKDAIDEPDERTYLVGHSLGCRAIMEYLSRLPNEQAIGGLVLVAGNITDVGFPEISNFFREPVDYQKVGKHIIRGTTLIYSDDDPFVPLDHGLTLRQELGGNFIGVHGAKHFSTAIDEVPDCKALPQVVDAIRYLDLLSLLNKP